MSLQYDMEYVLDSAQADDFEEYLRDWTKSELINVIHELVWMYKGLCD